ncbi:MAG TPA: HD domain-containing protein [Methylomirabilota bacterium]|nr:HD domain-containing protein [Methylomirabilota bacterium]
MWIPAELRRILTETPELRRAFLVGGCVRDHLLGLPVKDYDIEVFGQSYDSLVRALGRWGRTDLVGRSFGVVKLTTGSGAGFDFSIPRRDSKVAPGHKGFATDFDPGIDPAAAAARRDFTINSLMFDPARGEVLDFFGGRDDLARRILRHTSPAFIEDPLRVLRGMQFAGRFDLRADPETVALCRRIQPTFAEIATERVRDEWFKWAAKSVVPSAGLRFLEATGWIEHFPELSSLRGTPQDPEWHPEGDVFHHTCHCCDALARLPEWQQADELSRVVYMLAVLAHDFGKAVSTRRVVKEGRERVVSPGHEETGRALAERFLERIRAPGAVTKRVLPLVLHHMAHLQTPTDRAVRRLAKRLEPETIAGLCLVMTADSQGRPPRPPSVPEAVERLRARATALAVAAAAPRPILLGRHLLAIGLRPGPLFGRLLHDAFEAQIEGRFHDLADAWQWLATHPALPSDAAAKLRTHPPPVAGPP